MKKRALLITLATGLAVLPLACAQISPVARSLESGPDGWQRVGERQTYPTSEVEYLGASADGMIIVRMPGGGSQIWKR